MLTLGHDSHAANRKVLVVDDEAAIRFLLRVVLEEDGYIVTEAEHGGVALAMIKEHPPDLVITDVMMPVMGGPELIRSLRADPAYGDVPVIVVSANPDDVVDVNAVLTKPFLPDELLEAARSLLKGAA